MIVTFASVYVKDSAIYTNNLYIHRCFVECMLRQMYYYPVIRNHVKYTKSVIFYLLFFIFFSVGVVRIYSSVLCLGWGPLEHIL